MTKSIINYCPRLDERANSNERLSHLFFFLYRLRLDTNNAALDKWIGTKKQNKNRQNQTLNQVKKQNDILSFQCIYQSKSETLSFLFSVLFKTVWSDTSAGSFDCRVVQHL